MGMIDRDGQRATPASPGRDRRGLTLMELLLVIVMIGILGTVVLPRINDLTAHSKASEAAAVVQRDLERAFSIAARLRRPVYITADNSALIYRITDVSGDTLRIIRNLGETGEIGIQEMGFVPNQVTVQPNGIASSALRVRLTSHGTTRVVNMTRVGLIRRSR